MDITRAFTFIADDPDWPRKVGIATLIAFAGAFLFLPFIFLLYGYQALLVRNIMADEPTPLPDWDQWIELFGMGTVIFIVQAIYTLPFWLISCFGIFSVFGLGASGVEIGWLGGAGIIGSAGIWILVVIVGMTLIGPAVLIQYAREGSFASTMQLGKVFAIVLANSGSIIVSSVVLTIIWVGIGIATVGTLGIGSVLWFVAAPYLMLVAGHLYGQIGRQSPI